VTENTSMWSLPKFNFVLECGNNISIPFGEVLGLDTDSRAIEYHICNSNINSTIKLKHGVVHKDSAFWDWCDPANIEAPKPRDIVIKLLDKEGHSIIAWTITSAYLTKISFTEHQTSASELAIELIEINHAGLTVASA